jgi:hypothetical protein
MVARTGIVPRSHAVWLARRCHAADLWLRPDDGHISVRNSAVAALDWLGAFGRFSNRQAPQQPYSLPLQQSSRDHVDGLLSAAGDDDGIHASLDPP